MTNINFNYNSGRFLILGTKFVKDLGVVTENGLYYQAHFHTITHITQTFPGPPPPPPPPPPKKKEVVPCEVVGFRCCLPELCRLLGCYAA